MKQTFHRASYIERLERQRDYLLFAEKVHREWSQNADNEMVCHLHIETADLMKEAADRLNLILETLNGPVGKA